MNYQPVGRQWKDCCVLNILRYMTSVNMLLFCFAFVYWLIHLMVNMKLWQENIFCMPSAHVNPNRTIDIITINPYKLINPIKHIPFLHKSKNIHQELRKLNLSYVGLLANHRMTLAALTYKPSRRVYILAL